jgi:hypothetical protein
VSRLGRWWARRLDVAVTWLDHVADEGVVPKARRRLRRDEPDRLLLPGESVMDEVGHHWVAYTWPVTVLVLAALLLARSLLVVPVDVLWVPLVLVALMAGYGTDAFLRVRRERFLITDTRVMRLSGVYSRKAAWMPLSRVLDITVERPFWQRPLGCGHLVLENAAQEQGLRVIRLISHPGRRALLIHQLRTHGGEAAAASPSRPAHSRHPRDGGSEPPVRPVTGETYRGHRLA